MTSSLAPRALTPRYVDRPLTFVASPYHFAIVREVSGGATCRERCLKTGSHSVQRLTNEREPMSILLVTWTAAAGDRDAAYAEAVRGIAGSHFELFATAWLVSTAEGSANVAEELANSFPRQLDLVVAEITPGAVAGSLHPGAWEWMRANNSGTPSAH